MTVPVVRTAPVPVSEITGLRWEVPRPGLPREAAVLPEDGDPAAFHIASRQGDAPEALGRGTFFPGPFPGPLPGSSSGRPAEPAATAYRFRGTAGAPAARGAALLWCNGRTPARGFHERRGFRARGGGVRHRGRRPASRPRPGGPAPDPPCRGRGGAAVDFPPWRDGSTTTT